MISSLRILLLVLIFTRVEGQDSTAVAAKDSTAHTLVQFSPFYAVDERQSVNYMRSFNDADAFLTSFGVSVFNAIRGEVPNLVMSPAVRQPNASLRTPFFPGHDKAGYLVDGVPFNLAMGSPFLYNLNGFDFASVAAVSSPNALVGFELPSGSALILRSRNGAGYTRGTFEFNSFFTLAWGNNGENWLTSNSVAYMKDFGKIDARISYNLTTDQFEKVWDKVPYFHTIKINTGITITDRLSARLIIDNRFMNENYDIFSSAMTRNNNSALGNLTLNYRLAEGISLSSQWAQSNSDSTYTEAFNGVTSRKWFQQNSRLIGNLFANLQRKLNPSFTLGAVAGVQWSDGLADSRRSNFFGTPVERHLALKSQSAVGMVNLDYRSMLNLSVQYRHTSYDTTWSGGPVNEAFSVGAGYSFLNLLRLKPLSLGRIRVSYGQGPQVRNATYPYGGLPAPVIGPVSTRWEAGVDLGTTGGWQVSGSFFSEPDVVSLERDAGFYKILLTSERLVQGWEATVSYQTPARSDFVNRSSMLFSTNESKGTLAIVDPWSYRRASLLNESRWRSVALILLLEYSHLTGDYETTALKFREISLRIDSPFRASARRMSFTVSGRNLLEFFPGPDDEPRAGSIKSVSVSLNLVL